MDYSKIKELYFPIHGYDGYYEVSNFGNVRNSKTTGRILKLQNHYKDGYKIVDLHKDSNRCTKTVHRLVASAFLPNPDAKTCVDHIDGDRTNNNLENLRRATHQENTFNRKLDKRNTTGIKGVCFDKRINKWKSSISIDGKLKCIGCYDDIQDAINARVTKAREIYKDFCNE